jgi:hypothetical protein
MADAGTEVYSPLAYLPSEFAHSVRSTLFCTLCTPYSHPFPFPIVNGYPRQSVDFPPQHPSFSPLQRWNPRDKSGGWRLIACRNPISGYQWELVAL